MASQRPRGGGFALLSPAFLDELRHRTSLSALVGRTVKLQRAGNEWKAPCPFHHEKTPSFYVNDDKGFYHCFGCSAHGDAIRWLTEQQGLPFIDAVKELAAAAGLDMPAPDPVSRERAERAASLGDVVQAAADWFRAQLSTPAGAQARAYLDRRGIDGATAAAFGIGYAPASRRALADALKQFPADMLVEAGMLIRPDGGGDPYDRFRDRLMIPIHDRRGRAIAFGGRILGDGEPKYLNSPETPLFDKGATLFNLHRAAPAARSRGRLIVVEGYLDVIALHKAGIAEAVAPLGTALTERQMECAWSLVDQPLLCLDGDRAGIKAAHRAAERAMPLIRPGKSLAFATLPEGRDPDDIVRAGGAAAFEAAVASPASLLRLLYIRERVRGDMAEPEQRAGFRARLGALAETCTDKVVAEEFRRSFNDLFFEEFGWKRSDRRTLRADILQTRPVKPGDLGHSYARSALFGLMRHAAVLRRRFEAIANLPLDDRRLDRWRQALLSAVRRGDILDGDGIDAILAADGLPQAARFNLTQDLRFGFNRTDGGGHEGEEQLDRLIVCLNEERELDDALAALERAMRDDTSDEGYLAMQPERSYLIGRKASLYAWLGDAASGG